VAGTSFLLERDFAIFAQTILTR